ncbi:putative disease resistance protein At3g14460 [Citrus sinensis]|uniref:putative disease resistance protein At3g14460 n=1 Tax=Citrus sinensis TaxID=2711 RepID=UPI000D62E018|nr:putative disease resistance protein At3g14460 [Citrus sinensis]XP_052290177.1 putative disease resistance protein At3g14460 [Citrus sinensis]
MAQGYFSQRPNKEIDVIGEECFDIIARRSFFQEFVKNDDDEILSCKMHDIVHDFAQFLSKNECFTVEIDGREEPFIDSLGQNVRHSMVKLGKGAPFPISFCSVKRLRSLLIDDNGDDEFWLTEVLPQLFDELTCLRELDFAMFQMWSWNGFIKEIPKNIEKLVHLRYLNLSRLKIEKLPETLCELYNLQLLNVESCQDLKELPQGFGKLINLMYLLNRGTESLRYLPAGIERLTSLRRVEKFVVGRGVVGSKACGVESLRNLNLLRYCYIYGLGDLGDVGEARSSELENKKTSLICFFILVMVMKKGRERRTKKFLKLYSHLQI